MRCGKTSSVEKSKPAIKLLRQATEWCDPLETSVCMDVFALWLANSPLLTIFQSVYGEWRSRVQRPLLEFISSSAGVLNLPLNSRSGSQIEAEDFKTSALSHATLCVAWLYFKERVINLNRDLSSLMREIHIVDASRVARVWHAVFAKMPL